MRNYILIYRSDVCFIQSDIFVPLRRADSIVDQGKINGKLNKDMWCYRVPNLRFWRKLSFLEILHVIIGYFYTW